MSEHHEAERQESHPESGRTEPYRPGRHRYLRKKPLQESLQIFLGAVTMPSRRAETIAVEEALHRAIAQPIFAKISSPHYHGAAMDGIAVRAEDTFGASEVVPLTLSLNSKKPSARGQKPTDGYRPFQYVDTGSPLPSWANAVVMIERVFKHNDHEVEVRDAAAPWQHVRLVGEDIVATEPLLSRGHKVRPYDMGALLAAGYTRIPVKPKPSVAIIPTGSELIEPGDKPQPGRIIEFNSRVMAGFIEEWGGHPHRLPRVKDDLTVVTETLAAAVSQHDITTIIAGSSAGEHDFTVRAIGKLGEVLVHGIDIMPGKPAILAIIQGKPVVGIPGYPVSAVVVCQQILRPLIAKFLGCPAEEPPKVKAMTAKKIPSRLGLEEFIRVSLGKVGNRVIMNPLGRGAGVITTMVKADGVLRIPSLDEGINAGQEIEVELLRPREDIDNTILFTGSNDLTIGVLDDQLKTRYADLRISASNVGSLGGLVSLKRGEAHLIGTHLLDPASGKYNLPDIKKYLSLSKVMVMNLVIRDQGLIVAKGNPKKLKGIKDLVRKDVTFMNRQPGAGTRVLLDYKLKKFKIPPERIHGYEKEEFTHMAVAVAVASGLVDTGLGIKSAAMALGLDFIPVEREDYDLVFLKEFFENDRGQKLVEVIRSDAFKQAVEKLEGYNTTKTGTLKKA